MKNFHYYEVGPTLNVGNASAVVVGATLAHGWNNVMKFKRQK